VLFLTTSSGLGGMSRIVFSLVRQFAARGWAVRNVFPDDTRSPALLEWAREQAVPAESSPAVRDIVGAHSFADMRALRQLIVDCKPDVINLHYGENYISLKDLIAVRLAGRHRCVVTVYHPTPWSDMNPRKRTMTRLAAYLAHTIVAISNATRDVLREAGVPARKIQVIPCGLRVPDTLPPRLEARARLGLSPDAFVISSVGRLVSHKGFADLIEATARMSDPQRQLKLVIAGDGPERDALRGLAAERLGERAVLLGHIAEEAIADVYAAGDVFALPSYVEGFGLVYVEAAFYGTPSIGAKVGGVPDVIAAGETGLLVTPGDIDALATAIERLRNNVALRQSLGAAARARANAEFTEERMAERYATIFGIR